jgi:hypothetical protein
VPYITQPLGGTSILIRTGSGVITGAEILAEAREVDDRVPPGTVTHVLIDFSAVVAMHVSADEIQILATVHDHAKAFAPPVMVAVAAPPGMMFGMARMYASLANRDDWHVEVFPTIEEARAWIIACHDMRVSRTGASPAGG